MADSAQDIIVRLQQQVAKLKRENERLQIDLVQQSDANKSQLATKDAIAAFVEHMSDGFALLDKHGIVQMWNLSQERITGIRKIAALGRPINDVLAALPNLADGIFAPADLRSLLNRASDDRENTQPPRSEYEIQQPDSASISVETVYFPIRMDHELMLGCFTRQPPRSGFTDAIFEQTELDLRILHEVRSNNGPAKIVQSSTAKPFSDPYHSTNAKPSTLRPAARGKTQHRECLRQVSPGISQLPSLW